MNTTLRALSVALAAALIAPSAFAASAAIPTIDFHGYMRAGVGVSSDGSEVEWQKISWAVWGTSRIPMASWSWALKSIRKMTSASISTVWSAWSPTALTIMKPR